LQSRIPGDEVSPEDVSLNSRSQKDPISVTDNRIVFDHIAVVGGIYQADAEVVPLRNVAISA
jgi:hypothetical protein